ncbi:MAG: DUF6538 domain-containing protein [Sphingopyxis sp.]|uniref:DUF6538 domain-containing protein n=1 Tax=Sphingopyxis sp. TaxID=1908224 RepID=UPI003D6D9E60
MTGTRVQHLQRRSGIYHLRVRVPDDIRSLVGLTEVRRSLRTNQSSRARILAAVCAARVFEVFEMVKSSKLSKEQIRNLVSSLFEEMKRDIEASSIGRGSDRDRNEQLFCSTEVAAAVQTQRAIGEFDYHVQLTAQEALKQSRLRLNDLATISREDLLDGVARALIERERLYQFRLADRIADYASVDPLFSSPPLVAAQENKVVGPTLGEAIDTYSSSKRRAWGARHDAG